MRMMNRPNPKCEYCQYCHLCQILKFCNPFWVDFAILIFNYFCELSLVVDKRFPRASVVNICDGEPYRGYLYTRPCMINRIWGFNNDYYMWMVMLEIICIGSAELFEPGRGEKFKMKIPINVSSGIGTHVRHSTTGKSALHTPSSVEWRSLHFHSEHLYSKISRTTFTRCKKAT